MLGMTRALRRLRWLALPCQQLVQKPEIAENSKKNHKENTTKTIQGIVIIFKSGVY
jgi:hypothetical protein